MPKATSKAQQLSPLWAGRKERLIERYGSVTNATHMRRFGITKEDQLAKQFGRCAICGTTDSKQWEFDHDHVTGKGRGVLCGSCNRGLHWLEKEGWMEAALDYLESEGVINAA